MFNHDPCTVEVLVKGSFPDGCYQLHRLEQERLGHLINLTLEMRRLQGAVCTMAIRPYRFYFLLAGTYPVGNYRLMLNGTPYPFQVTQSPEDGFAGMKKQWAESNLFGSFPPFLHYVAPCYSTSIV